MARMQKQSYRPPRKADAHAGTHRFVQDCAPFLSTRLIQRTIQNP